MHATMSTGQATVIKRPLSLPLYLATYVTASVRNLLGPHRLIADQAAPSYEAEFELSAPTQHRWYDLFGVTDTVAVPFTYFSPASTLALLRYFGDLKVNLRHVLHVGFAMQVDSPAGTLVPGARYTAHFTLETISRRPKQRALLGFSTRIRRTDGSVVLTARDTFLIQCLPPPAGAAHGDATISGPALQQAPPPQPQRVSTNPVARRATIDFPSSIGWRYGLLSGDLNPVHTTQTGARIFGHQQPFAQGLCTANQILKTLVCDTGVLMREFEIAFTRPVVLGQAAVLYYTEHAYELCDQHARVLARGSWHSA